MVKAPAGPLEDEQTGLIAFGGWSLGDQIRGEMIIEISGLHGWTALQFGTCQRCEPDASGESAGCE
jgi:hypothetical protein